MRNSGIVEAIVLDPRLIEQLVGAEPPKAIWLASRMFTAEAAFYVEGDNEHFLVAHPDFWESVPYRAREIGLVDFYRPVRVTLIDDEPGDAPVMKESKRALRRRYATAIAEHLRRQVAGQ